MIILGIRLSLLEAIKHLHPIPASASSVINAYSSKLNECCDITNFRATFCICTEGFGNCQQKIRRSFIQYRAPETKVDW